MKKITGISITNEFIRIAEVKIDGESIKSVRLENVPYSKESFKNPEFIKNLKDLIKKEKIYTKGFISLDNRNVIVKDKIVPPIRKEEIFKLIEAEIKDYAIFNHQNVSLGFNVIEKAKDKFKIIWAGAKEDILLNTIKTLKKAGFKTVGVIPSNFALAKFIYTFYEVNSPSLIVDIDKTETTLTFISNGKVLYTYTQDLGIEEATSNEVYTRNNWLGNIVTTVTFIARNRNLSIDKIFLVSQENKVESLVKILGSRLPQQIIPVKLPENINFENEEDYLRMQKSGGMEFSEAVGLTLFAIEGVRDPLFCDISKHILVEKKSIGIKVATTILLLIIINGAALYFYPYINNTLKSLQTNIISTKSKINAVSKFAQQTEAIKNELSELDNSLTAYQTAKKDLEQRAITSALLAEIKAKLPKGVSLTSVSINSNGDINISGSGPSYKAILQYEVNLSDAKYIENASILSMSKNPASNATFNMVANIKGVNHEKK